MRGTRIRITILAAAIVGIAAAAKPFVAAQPAPGLEQAQAIARADAGVGQYFTAGQALRGRELYNRHCGYCHYANAGTMPTMSGIRGRTLAPRMLQKVVEGIARYPSVYYLFPAAGIHAADRRRECDAAGAGGHPRVSAPAERADAGALGVESQLRRTTG